MKSEQFTMSVYTSMISSTIDCGDTEARGRNVGGGGEGKGES